MNNPLISIIVPVYNIEKYISRCLDSLLAQTYTNIEIIAVNDGSTDRSNEILTMYSNTDRRIRVIQQKNSGVSSARNHGLDMAKGEFIGFCDGDDFVALDMFELLLNNALRYDADISHCGMVVEKTDGEKYINHVGDKAKIQNHEDGLWDLLTGEFIDPSCGTKLYRSFLFDNLRFANDITFNEDILLNFQLFQRARLSYFDDACKYHYIRREGSACLQKIEDKHVFHPVKVRERICKLCDDYSECEKIKELADMLLLRSVISAYCLVTVKAKKEYGYCRKDFYHRIRLLKHDIPLLSCNKQLQAYLILYGFGFRRFLLNIYYRFFAKKMYT